MGDLSHKMCRTKKRYIGLFISSKYLKIFNISLGFSSLNSLLGSSTLKDEIYSFVPFSNLKLKLSEFWPIFPLLWKRSFHFVAHTEGLVCTFSNIHTIIQFLVQNDFAISSDFSLSLRMIPAFDLHSLIVLQTTDEPIFLENISASRFPQYKRPKLLWWWY